MRLACAAAVVLAAACSPPSPAANACTAGFLGDPSASPDFDFLVVQADDTVVPLDDGGTVPLIFPPQGGRVIFVGVRATNVEGCALQLTGALRDPQSQQVRFDSRTVNLTPTGDGWGVSGSANEPISATISDFANIPVCPNQWSKTNVYGNRYGLEVTLKEHGDAGRQLTKKIDVVPQCAEPDRLQECLCICVAGYSLGQSCADFAADAGDGP